VNVKYKYSKFAPTKVTAKAVVDELVPCQENQKPKTHHSTRPKAAQKQSLMSQAYRSIVSPRNLRQKENY